MICKKSFRVDELNATEYGPGCMSNSSFTTSPQSVISENCLTVNVFVSDDCRQLPEKCPVIVYIHGGGWEFDAPRMYDPEVCLFALQPKISPF